MKTMILLMYVTLMFMLLSQTPLAVFGLLATPFLIVVLHHFSNDLKG